jgi:hypothetical protein
MIKREQKKKSKLGTVPTFYMESYSMDVVFAADIFPIINWSWHMSKPPIIVYFQLI